MSNGQNGKNPKNRLRGDSLKKYGESKLWDNIKAKKKEEMIEFLNDEKVEELIYGISDE